MHNANLRGILLMITAMAFFAVEDMFIKFAAAGMPAGQIIFISGLFGVPVFAAIARARGQSVFVSGAWHPAVLIRGGGEMVGSLALSQVLWIKSVGRLGIGLAALHINAAPFYVMLILFAFGAPWNWTQALGAAIVGLGVLVAQGVIPLTRKPVTL